MPTHDYDLANQSGAAFRADLNNALDAIVAWNSSASAPSPTFAYMRWLDTTNNLAKIRDGSNANWVTIASLSGTTWIPYRSGTAMGAALEQGLHTIWVPATSMVPRTTNGAASGTVETTTNKVMRRTLDFDQTTQEYAQFAIAMPKAWNESTITFIPYWTATSGTAAQTVDWTLAGVAFSNDDATDVAFGTAQTSSDAYIASGDLHIGPTSSAITIGNGAAENDLVIFQVSRNVGTDNLGGDAMLLGIKVLITYNAATDA